VLFFSTADAGILCFQQPTPKKRRQTARPAQLIKIKKSSMSEGVARQQRFKPIDKMSEPVGDASDDAPQLLGRLTSILMTMMFFFLAALWLLHEDLSAQVSALMLRSR
jgi:hypothetical protein